ncbi:MAG: lactoylglutathione lyase [Bacteroidetes bacterium]|nr:MAG: lactoylglutathione lyase [Bacteroidota bacterium]
MTVDIILYVEDQSRSKIFYENLFACKAILDVPGMTEIQIASGLKLGVMPENGIAKIITPAAPHPSSGKGIPRCELYIQVENIEDWVLRSISAGAKLISAPENRNWGDRVAYVSDPDGHILAFATRSKIAG